MAYQYEQIEKALRLLNGRLVLSGSERYNLIVCGGTALVATRLVLRTTRDVDIVALADEKGILIDPEPMPEPLITAAEQVAEDLGLSSDWLNNGPSSGEGGLFRLGLPDGFSNRLLWNEFGEKLKIAFISRIDQIYFKLYAAVDQFGSYHATDLIELEPTDEELLAAAEWSREHDPSNGYLESVRIFFKEYGYGHLLKSLS